MSYLDWIAREQRRYQELAHASLRWREQITASMRIGDLVADRLRISEQLAPQLSSLVAQGTALSSVARLQDELSQIQGLAAETIARYYDAERVRFEALVAAVQPAVMPAAWASMLTLGDRLSGWDDRSRKYDAALAKLGWWFPPNLPASEFVDAGELAIAGKRIPLRQHMARQVQGRRARGLVEEWLGEPLFRDRRRFLIDGARDHKEGRYRVSIPTLLPLIEGIAIEAFMGKSGDTSPKSAVKAGVSAYGDAADEALLQTVTFLWTKTDFLTFRGSSRLLNRHVVLHGRSLGYATEANSAQVFFALDHLHALIKAAAKIRSATP